MSSIQRTVVYVAALFGLILAGCQMQPATDTVAAATPLTATAPAAALVSTATALPTQAPAAATQPPTPTVAPPTPTVVPPTEPPPPPSPTAIAATPFPGAEPILTAAAEWPFAAALRQELVPVRLPAEDVPANFAEPAHAAFHLDAYPAHNNIQQAVVRVYPVEAYMRVNAEAAGRLLELESLLDARPGALANRPTLPFLPVQNAAQLFRARIAPLAFQNGRGLRFLTVYGQYFAPIANDTLFYTFQGLTDDGAYLVSATLPVSSAALPATVDEAEPGAADIAGDYDSYAAERAHFVEGLESSAFTPDLDELDAFIASLLVEADPAAAAAASRDLGALTFTEPTYGFSFAYPANFAVAADRQVVDQQPPGFPLRHFYWLVQLDREPGAATVMAPFTLQVLEGDLAAVDEFRGQTTTRETTTFNGYEALVQTRSDGDLVDYTFADPTRPDTWIIFTDAVSQFPQREAQAAGVAGVLEAILKTVAFPE